MAARKAKKGLSERQEQILQFIREYARKEGRPPTVREIGSAVGISSTSVVDYNLNALAKKGYLTRNPHVSRGIRISEMLKQATDLITVPVLGIIHAGELTPPFDPVTVDESDDWLELTQDIVPQSQNLYALRVEGDSMIDALVNDGDIVVMTSNENISNGDMVAAWIVDREETTLKRFYLEGERVRLQPANPAMAPMYFDAHNVQPQGKVVAIIRQLN
ncbi:MAG: repressor LexA [Chloroflexi bacterium]|nr:repressor LexA [Chloroflexota bacterium]